MKNTKKIMLATTALATAIISIALVPQERPHQDLRERAEKLMRESNYAEAYDVYRKFLFSASADPRRLPQDFENSVNCLRSLGRIEETDALREEMAGAHPDNWRVLASVAQSWLDAPPQGYLIAGDFKRGPHRGGGQFADCGRRDRVRALQLMNKAMPLLARDASAHESSRFHIRFAAMLSHNHSEAWRLQYLTDFNELPEVEEAVHWWGYRGVRGSSQGAPVDADGNPVFHARPDRFEAARSDGERWRWLLWKAQEVNHEARPETLRIMATFLQSQFGTETLADYSWFFYRSAPQPDRARDESGTYALHTLAENETIARLAIGIRRFELPDEFNHIKYYQELEDFDHLASIFQNRRQFPAAAEYWRRAIRVGGRTQARQRALDQIVRNWGEFEPIVSQPAGEGATLEYKFRNGKRVEFSAYSIDVPTLLEDVKQHLRRNPRELDYRMLQIDNLGWRLVQQDEKKYRGAKVAEWDLELEPADDHFDRRITVETPLEDPGAYLLTARMDDGNESNIVVWLQDTAIVKRNLGQDAPRRENDPNLDWYYIADARTGEPIEGATVDFFGYWSVHERVSGGNSHRLRTHTINFAEYSDEHGQVVPDPEDYSPDGGRGVRYIVTATTEDGRFSYLGFTGVWRANYNYDQRYHAERTYCITDRPIYRPGHEVNFKAWIRNAQYDMPNESRFAGHEFEVRIIDPRNEEVYRQTHTADEYGGVGGVLELPEDATLGQYRIIVGRTGGTNFRVEEYRTPEFEVLVDSPDEPVMLGDEITAMVRAKYYWGEPVREGRAKIKVTRVPHSQLWFPVRPWDWLYGRGYWWFASDYDWYPGWSRWGCLAPLPIWRSQPTPEPEVVFEREVEVGPDGEIPVVIDTALAQAMHGDQDHRYSISAEVTDKSRRTIVGSGDVLVAREPFKVHTWIDRGHYRVGDTVKVSVNAQTIDTKPVEGEGILRLLEISYDEERQPIEKEVQLWRLSTDARGRADKQINASRPGQYRISYKLQDKRGNEIEGGYVFVVRGVGDDRQDFRFNAIELVPDKTEYAPGEQVRLMINTDREDGTVVLFLRPSNGVYLPPKILRLKGHSKVVSIDIDRRDMPNTFVEAFTVSDGDVHTAVREIMVPPEERIINLEVVTDQSQYEPGEQARVEVRLTDENGDPIIGSTAITLYDRAIEYISGGSNVGEIKEFFWKWRRSHNPHGEHNLMRRSHPVALPDTETMRPIGLFGHSVADEIDSPKNGFSVRGVGRSVGGEAVMLRSMPMVAEMALADSAESGPAPDAAAPGVAPADEPVVRQDFADTAYWNADVEVDETGLAILEFKMPDNLTGWKMRVWSMGHGTRVGEATTEVVTRKNLMVRMQSPRFFTQRDEVVLSANVHNYFDEEKEVLVKLELDGVTLRPMDDLERRVTIAAGGETRVDWRVKAVEPGEATVRMLAIADTESDAMQLKFPVYIHGMLRTEIYSGALRPEQSGHAFTFTVPAERQPEQSRLEVRWSPSIAGAMVDALPYLADYPFNSTDQTISRFLPAVLTRKTLVDMGIDLESIRDKHSNLNPQEIGDDQERAAQWKRFKRNPVFDQRELDRMVKEGLKRIYDMQLGDGGWGWFSGRGERSSAHTTAYVVNSLQLAQASGLAIVPGALERGRAWLESHQREQVANIKNDDHWKKHPGNGDAFVFMVLTDAHMVNTEMRDLLYEDRDKLSLYGKSMVGLALDRIGRVEERDMLIRNISQFVVQDRENQSAWLNMQNSSFWWFWYGSEFETHAYFLKLLARTDPQSEVASGIVKYLVNNRKHATYWSSTRDTAICVEAMAEYLQATGEMAPDLQVEVRLNGETRAAVRITADNIFDFDNALIIEGEELTTGEHTVEIRKTGEGSLYFNAYQTNFTLEDYIERAGLEVKVERRFYRLEEDERYIKARGARGQVVEQQVERYKRIPIGNLDMLKSGDLVEVELVVESKNDYEYIVIEDRKPAGFEPVEQRSGYSRTGLRSYVEYRDERVVFFAQRLARGQHSMSYRVRAEIPGRFSAMPTVIQGLYAPELRGNSDEIKIQVKD